MENLWIEVGNGCLKKAASLLQKETALTEEAIRMIKELVDIAIALDQEDLAWGNKRNIPDVSALPRSGKEKDELANTLRDILIEQSSAGTFQKDEI